MSISYFLITLYPNSTSDIRNVIFDIFATKDTGGKMRDYYKQAMSPFPTMFSMLMEIINYSGVPNSLDYYSPKNEAYCYFRNLGICDILCTCM